MKTVILAGMDNLTFMAADLLNPMEFKLIGYATTIEAAWNIYDGQGKIREDLEEMPVMPFSVAVGYGADCMILTASQAEENEQLKYKMFCMNYQGEVISLYESWRGFSPKTAAIRKMAWRLESLGVSGAAADLGAGRGDVSWQLNALMPERRLYLFDTFTGYDVRDIKEEQERKLSRAKAGEFSLSPMELENLNERILSRMPYPDQVVIKKGWFPETAYELEESYALVYMDTGLYRPTYSGIQYFFPRLSKGGIILVSGYENGKNQSVQCAVHDLEKEYGAFLITPLCDLDGTIIITHP